MLHDFLIETTEHDDRLPQAIARHLWPVFSQCNELTFDQFGEPWAYAVCHFLPRYWNALSSYVELGRRKQFPFPPFLIEVLDIGTGPGPCLLAGADAAQLMREFDGRALPAAPDGPANLHFVERSNGFCEWLGHFNEYLSWKLDGSGQLRTPYPQLLSFDFDGLDPRALKSDLRETLMRSYEDDDGDWRAFAHHELETVNTDWKNAYRYNLVNFSHFFTEVEHVERYAPELQSVTLSLRKDGVLAVFGGRGDNYPEIYTEIKQVIESGNYGTKKAIGRCMEIETDNSVVELNWSSDAGRTTSAFYSRVIAYMRSHEVWGEVDVRAQELLLSAASGKSKPLRHAVHVFKKVNQKRARVQT